MTKEQAELMLKQVIDQIKLTAAERDVLMKAIAVLKGDV